MSDTIYLFGHPYFEEGVDGDLYLADAYERVEVYATEATRDDAALAADREFIRDVVRERSLASYCPEHVVNDFTLADATVVERWQRDWLVPLSDSEADALLDVLPHLKRGRWAQELKR